MSSPPRVVTADRGDAGRRLDLVLHRHLNDVETASRSRVQHWIEDGQVLLNGVPVRRVSTRAAFGDVLLVTLPESPPRHAMKAEDAALDVLYEDDHLMAVNKPAGVVVHPTYRHLEGTTMNALLWHARQWPSGQRPSLLGRLDKGTSGLLLVAKSPAAHAALQRILVSPRAEKDYLAVVYGRVATARGQIDLRLARDPGDRRRVVASTSVGAESLTEFERLARVAAPRVGLSMLRCRLMTGRMHQIRVHLTARGWPLVGDPKYGAPHWAEITEPSLAASVQAFPRQALHAWRLAFPHPVSGARLTIEAPLPDDFRDLLRATGLTDRRQAHDARGAARTQPS